MGHLVLAVQPALLLRQRLVLLALFNLLLDRAAADLLLELLHRVRPNVPRDSLQPHGQLHLALRAGVDHLRPDGRVLRNVSHEEVTFLVAHAD